MVHNNRRSTMKGTSALALLASMATVNAFFVAPGAPVLSRANHNSVVRMSASEEVAATTAAKVESNVVDAAELSVRKPPGDVKLDQGVMDR